MNSFQLLCWGYKRESTLTQICIHPFLGLAPWVTGMRYRTSPILGLPWMLFQLLTSFPSVTPGCCEPNPLLSSVVGAQGRSRLGPEEPNSACPGSGVQLFSFSSDETQAALRDSRAVEGNAPLWSCLDRAEIKSWVVTLDGFFVLTGATKIVTMRFNDELIKEELLWCYTEVLFLWLFCGSRGSCIKSDQLAQ